ncbi:MAG: TIR domain-containing protein [Hyphomonadaceae bacterium]|nr:TIR domain-containing protein [Hyphomonadaceae bacterium]
MSEQQDNREAIMREHVAAIGGKNAIAVFDFGTRGVRVIVGPKSVPAEIGEHTIRMEGRKPNVGLDVADKRLPLNAQSLRQATTFIRAWRQLLQRCGVTDIRLISTAWFRWLENKNEVLTFVRKKTGLTIEMIDQQREAELTLLSIPVLVERWRGRKTGPAIADNDTVALIDQGGGSLQVSWMRWGDRKKDEIAIYASNFPYLGTVARRRDFFGLNAEEAPVDNPLDNAAGIRAQVQRIAKAARLELQKDLALPTAASCAPGKLHFFAVGSAITDLAPDGVYKRHNHRVSATQMQTKLDERLHQLNAEREQVRSVWRGMRLPEKDQTDASRPWFDKRKRLDEILTSLFGLPVYREVLELAKVDELTVSGYGLSYGYYFSQCIPKVPQVAGKAPDDRGPYMFISYCHDDEKEIEADLGQLRAMGVRTWFDREKIKGGDKYRKLIANKIAVSAGLIVFLTPRSIKRDWVEWEVGFAKEERKLIIPIVLEPMTLPPHWRFLLTGIDQVLPHELGPDRYQAKLAASIPEKCKRGG